MQRSLVLLVATLLACSPKRGLPADAGPPEILAPGFLGTTEPDAPRPDAHPVDAALGDDQRPCVLLSSGEVWCWRLDRPSVFPGRVPGTWDKRVDGIRAAHGRLLLHADGQYALFQGDDTQASATRHRTWFRKGPVGLGVDEPTGWQCSGTSSCLVGSASGFRWVDDATGVQALPAPAACKGAAFDLVFTPDEPGQPWAVRCGAQSVLVGVVPGAAPTLVSRVAEGLPPGSRLVGWHGSGRAEVQTKDGKLAVYFAPISQAFSDAAWTGSAAQPFAPSDEVSAPVRPADKPPCTLDGSEVVCTATAPPVLAERARKLATSFLAAPRQLWTTADVACAWGSVLEGSWGVRCITVHDESPRDVSF